MVGCVRCGFSSGMQKMDLGETSWGHLVHHGGSAAERHACSPQAHVMQEPHARCHLELPCCVHEKSAVQFHGRGRWATCSAAGNEFMHCGFVLCTIARQDCKLLRTTWISFSGQIQTSAAVLGLRYVCAVDPRMVDHRGANR